MRLKISTIVIFFVCGLIGMESSLIDNDEEAKPSLVALCAHSIVTRLVDDAQNNRLSCWFDTKKVPQELLAYLESILCARFSDDLDKIKSYDLLRIIKLDGMPTALEMSHDSSFFVVATNTSAKIWGINDQKPAQELIGHVAWIRAIAISDDGEFVVTASEDSTARIWDIKTGTCLHVLQCEHPQISAAISQDNSTVATASRRKAYLWNTHTGELIQNFEPRYQEAREDKKLEDEQIFSINAVANNEYIITQYTPIEETHTFTSCEHGETEWKTTTTTALYLDLDFFSFHAQQYVGRSRFDYHLSINVLAMNIDGDLIVGAGVIGCAGLYRCKLSGEKNYRREYTMAKIRTSKTKAISISLDASLIGIVENSLTGDKLLLIDAETGMILYKLDPNHLLTIKQVIISKNKKYVIAGYIDFPIPFRNSDCSVHIWESSLFHDNISALIRKLRGKIPAPDYFKNQNKNCAIA